MLDDLRTFIIGDTAVQALISSRMYPTMLPQAVTLPALTYQVVSATRAPTMRHNDNLPTKRIQIDAWSRSVDEARAVAEAIRALFHYYERGDITGVQGVFLQDEREDYEPDTLLYRVSRDYMVHHAEA